MVSSPSQPRIPWRAVRSELHPSPREGWSLAALTFLSMKTRNYQNYPFRPPLWSEVPAIRTSHTPAHHNVALSEGGHDLESLLLEHRDGSEVLPVGSPADDRIGFNDTPSPVSYGL